VTSHADILLTEAELELVTGYKRAAEQLVELHRQGFSRARRDRLGRLVLERAHYDAVCAGAVVRPKPKVRHMAQAS
jgi:hypothetical protein